MGHYFTNAKDYFANALDFIIDTAHIGLWDIHIPTGKAVYSKEFERLIGYEEGELSKSLTAWEQTVYSGDLEYVKRQIEAYLTGKIPVFEVQYRMICKDGTLIWIKDMGAVTEWDEQGVPLRFTGTIQDIGAIKKAEEDLKIKNEQLNLVRGLSGLVLWDYDAARGHIQYGDDFFIMTGYGKDEITGTRAGWHKVIHSEDVNRILAVTEKLLSGKIDTFAEEIRIRRKNGEYIWILETGKAVAWREDGTTVKIIGGFLNIDKLKRAEERLQEALAQNKQYNRQLKAEVEHAVKTLEKSRKLSQVLFDANPHINIILDDQCRAVDCNPMTVQYFGFSSKEETLDNIMSFIAQSIPEFQPDGSRSLSIKDRLAYAITHGYNDFETELIFWGRPVPLRVILKRIAYKDSYAIAAYLVDLRSLREAKNELLRQDRILRIINNGATRLLASDRDGFDQAVRESLKAIGESVDADRMYIWENYTEGEKQYCRQIYEWSEHAEPQQGKDFTRGLDYDEIPNWRDTLRQNKTINAVVRKYPFTIERTILEAQGIRSVLAIPIFFKDHFWGFAGFDDCKNERIFSSGEEHLLHSGCFLIVSAILRNLVTNHLICAREEALASTRAKSEFLSRMSHEIRTPMNAIIGMTTIARKSSDTAKMRYCLNKIDNASRQLMGLINDILDMSKIEANKFEIMSKEFNFEMMIQNAVNVIQVRVEEKKQQFIVDFDDIFTRNVISDELRLFQVILNLLSNAVKFTPDQGTIILRVRRKDLDAGHAQLYVEVKDTGIGISQEQQSRLFTSFEQADGSITRKFGGTGLGLALCKKIIELMNGKIWIESGIGNGSSFFFTVDITWGSECWQEPADEKVRRDFPILVIDDSEDVLEYFKNILGSFSMSCETACSGAAGLRSLKNADRPYRIVFLDWRMPGENGVEIAKNIREIAGPDIAIVLMSVVDWPEIEAETKTGGSSGSLWINQFLTKPIMPSTLYNTIVRLLEHTFITDNHTAADMSVLKLEGKRILVVEDIEINREIIGSILEETGVSIDYAVNGIMAIETFKKRGEQYDLILMDVQMPEMDGLDATRQIRALNTGYAKTVTVIAMTANAFNEDIAQCLAAGMNDHVAKPIDVAAFLATLQKYI
ncbi:MAG: response regulator [Treponema sp.]|jgi:PAS domain S-box-containing protein|nr:response regulator [Treponema sp.]